MYELSFIWGVGKRVALEFLENKMKEEQDNIFNQAILESFFNRRGFGGKDSSGRRTMTLSGIYNFFLTEARLIDGMSFYRSLKKHTTLLADAGIIYYIRELENGNREYVMPTQTERAVRIGLGEEYLI